MSRGRSVVSLLGHGTVARENLRNLTQHFGKDCDTLAGKTGTSDAAATASTTEGTCAASGYACVVMHSGDLRSATDQELHTVPGDRTII